MVTRVIRFFEWLAAFLADWLNPVVSLTQLGPHGGHWLGVTLAALVLALLLLLGLKACSNQEQMRRRKGQVGALFLEMHLFRHDPVMNLCTIGRMLKTVLLQLSLWLKPLACLSLPMLLLLSLYQNYLEDRPLRPGEELLVKAIFASREEADNGRGISLTSSAPNVLVETEAFHSPSEPVILWRIRAAAAMTPSRGLAEVPLRLHQANGEEAARIPIKIAPTSDKLESLADLIFVPRSTRAVHVPRSIEIGYPAREWYFWSRRFHWLVVLFVLTLGWMFLLKRPLRTEF